MNYKIYQIANTGKCKYSFMNFGFAEKNGLSLTHYEEVYKGKLNEKDSKEYSKTDGITANDAAGILEKIFETFNINRPSDFKGHSLSMSDIVYLGGKYWYCDTYQWKECDF